MLRPYRDTLTGETVMLTDHQVNISDRSRFKRLDPNDPNPPVINPDVEIAMADLGDVTQVEHAATLPDNPPYPLVGDFLEGAGKPDIMPPRGPNAS
jgi:hypothetical protein